ncbi:MAG TPA: class I SAM-dependent methyltransferase [Pyrinomonadaceae bacterium]
MLKSFYSTARRVMTPRMFKQIIRKAKNTLHPVIDISDEFTELLSGINAGWLERGNLYSFDYAMRNLPSEAPIIEIGSFCGLSTNLLAYYKQANSVKNKVVNCDKWQWNDTGQVGHSTFTYPEYLSFAKDAYIRNVQMFSRDDLPYTIELFSDEFFQQWRENREVSDVFGRTLRLGGPISFCFIDGNHAYDYAKRDFVNTDEFLESGGFILFDDSADGTKWEVSRVRDEVIATRRYDVVAKNPNYLFRKK